MASLWWLAEVAGEVLYGWPTHYEPGGFFWSKAIVVSDFLHHFRKVKWVFSKQVLYTELPLLVLFLTGISK